MIATAEGPSLALGLAVPESTEVLVVTAPLRHTAAAPHLHPVAPPTRPWLVYRLFFDLIKHLKLTSRPVRDDQHRLPTPPRFWAFLV